MHLAVTSPFSDNDTCEAWKVQDMILMSEVDIIDLSGWRLRWQQEMAVGARQQVGCPSHQLDQRHSWQVEWQHCCLPLLWWHQLVLRFPPIPFSLASFLSFTRKRKKKEKTGYRYETYLFLALAAVKWHWWQDKSARKKAYSTHRSCRYSVLRCMSW